MLSNSFLKEMLLNDIKNMIIEKYNIPCIVYNNSLTIHIPNKKYINIVIT